MTDFTLIWLSIVAVICIFFTIACVGASLINTFFGHRK